MTQVSKGEAPSEERVSRRPLPFRLSGIYAVTELPGPSTQGSKKP